MKIGSKHVNTIGYEDDMVLVAESKEKQLILVYRLMQECRRMGVRVNEGKTKVKGGTRRSVILSVAVGIDCTTLNT